MKIPFAKALRIASAAAVLAAASLPSQTAAQSFDEGYIQTLQVTSTRGPSQMHQIYNEGTGNTSITRVCVVNYGDVQRAFTHTVVGINPLVAQPGGQSCANFAANSRVAFGMVDGAEPAQANRAMVMNLDAFAGGTVNFIWQ